MSLLSAGGTTLSIVSQVLSAIALITALLPINQTVALIVFIILVLIYVFFGGDISLGYMGILKAVLMAIGFLACGVVAYLFMGKSLYYLPKDPNFNIFAGGV